MSFSVVAALVVVVAVVVLWTWRIVKWVWIKPKMLESCLRRQGLTGTPYTPFVGDIRRNVDMMMEARSKPINITDDITPRLLPLASKMLNSHGIVSPFAFLLGLERSVGQFSDLERALLSWGVNCVEFSLT